jgi:hypothetical protein
MNSERKEAWMRIVVLIVSGIILGLWKALIQIITLVNWIIVIFSGKRSKELAEFSEIWNTQVYVYLRYMTFVTNRRPFPFNSLDKSMSKYGK